MHASGSIDAASQLFVQTLGSLCKLAQRLVVVPGSNEMLPNFATMMLASLVVCGLAGCIGRTGCNDVIRVNAPHVLPDARELTRQGVSAVQRGDMAAGEASFRRAIFVDEAYGPAHNNLGRIYFERRDWKRAADAFHWAMEYMPGRPEPLNNLGLVFESAGKFDSAIAFYRQAHDASREQPEYLANLVRARMRRGDQGSDLRAELQALKFIENRPDWAAWVDEQLALSPQVKIGAGSTNEIRIRENGGSQFRPGLSELPSTPEALNPPDPISIWEGNGLSDGPELVSPVNAIPGAHNFTLPNGE